MILYSPTYKELLHIFKQHALCIILYDLFCCSINKSKSIYEEDLDSVIKTGNAKSGKYYLQWQNLLCPLDEVMLY